MFFFVQKFFVQQWLSSWSTSDDHSDNRKQMLSSCARNGY